MLVRQVILMMGMCTLAIALPHKRVAVVEKRIPSDIQIAKRFLTFTAEAKPAVEYHTGYIQRPAVEYQTGFIPIQTNDIPYYDPSTQVFYYVLPDGSIKYVQGAPQVQVQQPQVQISQPGNLELSWPSAEESSSGGLLSFLQKPLTAAGNIIQKTGDVASDIISLPFDAGRQVVAGVGLDNTAVGKLATGILNVGEGIEQTKLNILSNVAQAPFRIGANIAGSLDEE